MSEIKKPVPVRLDDRHLEMIDELRRVEKDIPTRSEMIRRLIERAAEKRRK
ncbi:ribbon-helix-helix protein, CopG family [Hyphomicrobium sp. B1]|uniref:ribbon-helix-helix protein, CopG family n=1 Tax=Hyphomicrobium sp. B1 TaxID=3075651 RepID=UPI003C30116C